MIEVTCSPVGVQDVHHLIARVFKMQESNSRHKMWVVAQ